MKTINPTKTMQQFDPRQTLLSLKSEMLSGLGDKADTLKRPENAALEDLAPVFHDQYVASLLNRLDFQRLQQVNDAIARIQKNSYGICSECDEPSAGKRLQAIPWAVRCVTCEDAWIPTEQEAEMVEEFAA